MTCSRGSSNSNDRGNTRDRAARRAWLVKTFRANVDLGLVEAGEAWCFRTVERGEGLPACRCYCCGVLLTEETVTVDRIIPKVDGGTYRRNNIRPACGHCNSSTGGSLAGKRKKTA